MGSLNTDMMLDAQDRQQLDHYHDLSVGEILRRMRIAQGLGLTGISETLNIRLDHLSAIENNDLSKLPPRVYALGFVRAYADFLGLEGEKLVYLFKSQMVGRRAQLALSPGMLKAPEFILDFRFAGVAAMVIVLLGSAMIWGWQANEEGGLVMASADDVPAVEDVLGGVVAVDEEPPVMADAAGGATMPSNAVSEIDLSAIAPAAGAKVYGIRQQDAGFAIQANDVTWLEVKTVPESEGDEVKVLLTRVLSPGDIFYAPADQVVEVNTGNALGLEIMRGDEKKKFPNAQDVVVRGLRLKNGLIAQ